MGGERALPDTDKAAYKHMAFTYTKLNFYALQLILRIEGDIYWLVCVSVH